MAKDFSIGKAANRVPIIGILPETYNATKEIKNATPKERVEACKETIHDFHINRVPFIGPMLNEACSLFE